MSAIVKTILSGSVNGKNINVSATADPGTTIHTTSSGTAAMDEIWLFAINTSGVLANVTVEWGNNTNPNDFISATLQPYQGLNLLVPGLLLQNSLSVKAYSNVANIININGYVNRITP